MELSPLAREKLAKIGELSPEEKEKLKLYEELTSILADYFTDRLSLDGLWKRMKEFKENGRDSMIAETQLRLINAISLGGNKTDFERCRSGILCCETFKEPNRYHELEHGLNLLDSLRQQYRQDKDAMFNSMKTEIQRQVELAARQIARQAGNRGISIDIQGSVEASVRNSPAWNEFLLKHERIFGQKFDECLAKIKSLV